MVKSKKQDIAIIGMSCKFPQADSCQEFWNNLVSGKDSVCEVTKERWDIDEYYETDITNKNKTYAKWCAQIDDIDKFDNSYFNISPKEAQAMDPKQRILLEQVARCIEDAGVSLNQLQKKVTSVYVGIFENDYQNMAAEPERDIEKFTYTGSHEAILANRVSYFFDLKGLSMPINTGCSASGVAIYEAQRALQNYECDFALVCGANVRLTPYEYIGLSKTHMLSPDGHCKTLDATANGYVPGEGVGVILLQRREDAENNYNHIYALVTGTAVNHVGNTGSLTAPSVEGQKRLITSALTNADINPETVGYIELHGSGTSLGDPIEIEALKQAYGKYTDKKSYCYVGSVKPYIGHLEGAACIAGVIKTVLMLKNKKIPDLHINELNPIINFSKTPFIPADGTRSWERLQENIPLRAGVSSFGFGGVNAHIILEEYPTNYKGIDTQEKEPYIFALSAKSESSLLGMIEEWKKFLDTEDAKEISLKDMCLTLLSGRQSFPYRIAGFVSTRDHIKKVLERKEIVNTGQSLLNLTIGDEIWEGFEQVKDYIHTNDLLGQEIDKQVMFMEQQKPGSRELYYGDIWKDEDKSLFTFVTDLGILEYARELGCDYSKVNSMGIGTFIGDALANGTPIQENIKDFIHKKAVRQPLEASNLNSVQQWISEVENHSGLEEVYQACLEKHEKLYDKQMSYTRFVAQWETILKKHMEIDFNNLREEKSVNFHKLVITTLIIDALERLSAKWNIQVMEEKVIGLWGKLLKIFKEDSHMREVFVAIIFNEEAVLNNIAKVNENSYISKIPEEDSSWLFFCHGQKNGFYGFLEEAWRKGAHINWSEVFCHSSYQKVSLPVYIFDKYSFWMRGKYKVLPVIPSSQKLLNIDNLHLMEHNIGGRSLIPGSYYITQFFRNAMPNEQGIKKLKQIHLLKAKWLENNTGHNLMEVEHETSLSVLSEDKILATAVIDAATRFEKSFQHPLSIEYDFNQMEIYQRLRQQEYFYGRSFRVIEKIEQSQGDCFICSLKLEEHYTDTENLLIYLLDGILQGILFTGYTLNLINPEQIYIPVSFHTIEAGIISGREFTLEIRGQQLIHTNSKLFADVTLFDSHGQEVLSITQAAFAGMSIDSFVGRKSLKLYRPVWEKTSLSLEAMGEEKSDSQMAIVFATTQEQILHLEPLLLKKYKQVVILKKSDESKRISETHYEINSENIASLKEILEDLSTTSMSPCTVTIIYLWSLCEKGMKYSYKETTEAISSAFVAGFHDLFHTIKALAAKKEMERLNLCCFTGEVYSIIQGDNSKGYRESFVLPMLKTAMLEINKLQAKVVDVRTEEWESPDFYEMITREAGVYQREAGIAYRKRERYIEGIEGIEDIQTCVFTEVKEQGVYLVVGGAGGIGAGIVQMLKSLGNPQIAVLGRSSQESKEVKSFLNQWSDGVVYYSCDIVDSQAVKAVISQCLDVFGSINGIFQCAGILLDKLIHFREIETCNKAIHTKVTGTCNLVEYTKDLNCDFFLSCSSIVSVLGNAGQIDYAAANGFLDSYMEYLEKKYPGTNYGSINWTLWLDTGMGNDTATVDKFRVKAGVIESHNGYDTLRKILGGGYNRVMAVSNKEGFEQAFYNSREDSIEEKVKQQSSTGIVDRLTIKVQIIKMLSTILGLKEQDVDEEIDLRELGLESISLIDFSEAMSKEFKIDMNASMLFEYTTIHEITDYITKQIKPEATNKRVEESVNINIGLPEESDRISEKSVGQAGKTEDIAIIGFAGHFPDSRDYRDFWNKLAAHHDFITEEPVDRWNLKGFSQYEKKSDQKTNVNWGAYLEDIKGFDASFFHISPKEAELLDPQQRIILEDSWHALEAAGYKPLEIRGTNTGVFIGACNTDYGDLMLKDNYPLEAYTSTGTYLSIIPNRVSYYFDFHGPSLAVDTACSSSLTAIYHGVRALQAGDCNMALAGAVNIIASPRYHMSFDHAGMLSQKGNCSTFDEAADGYVRAEGSGVIVLKRLQDALEDKDSILAVIKGVGINHGGMANSLTAPNPFAQKELLKAVYKKAGVTADTISYIETHGTGTPLGDPIEINSLKGAFLELKGEGETTQKHCGLGALKSNMGHAEPASGILGIIKVLMCMQNKMLIGNLHFDRLNKNINLEDSPFFLIAENEEWKPLVNELGDEMPRRAGVSSFGFGGANGHIILEEFQKKEKERTDNKSIFILSGKTRKQLQIYATEMVEFLKNCIWSKEKDTFSCFKEWLLYAFANEINVAPGDIGETEEFLNLGCDTLIFHGISLRLHGEFDLRLNMEDFVVHNTIETLARFICCQFGDTIEKILGGKNIPFNEEKSVDYWKYPNRFRDVAYTLQKAREDMEERLGFLADNFEEAATYLTAYLNGEPMEGLFTGSVDVNYKRKSEVGTQAANFQGSTVLKRWIQGEKINWSSTYSDINRPDIVMLPEYPFEHKNFWLPFHNRPQLVEDKKPVELNFYSNSYREVGLTKGSARVVEQFNLIMDSNLLQRYSILPLEAKHIFFEESVTQKNLEDCFYNRYRSKDSLTRILLVLKEIDISEPDKCQQILKRFQNLSKAINTTFKNRVCIYLVTIADKHADNAAYSFFKSLGLVLSNVVMNTITIIPDASTDIRCIVSEELENEKTGQNIKYEHNRRFVRELHTYKESKEKGMLLDRGKTYIITGGCGGIGRILARHLAKKYKGNLILTGRSQPNSDKQRIIKSLEEDGAKVMYLTLDVTDQNTMGEALERIHQTFGAVNGVIHCAGYMSKNTILNQTEEEMNQTLQVKIKGALELTRALRYESLDFFVLFSSISADLGDFGQCSYAMANALLDKFTDSFHIEKKHAKETSVISIHWPLWENGGMHLSGDGEDLYLKSSKMKYLSDDLGMEAFETILTHGTESIIVLAGNKDELDNSLGVIPTQAQREEIAERENSMDGLLDSKNVLIEVKSIACEILKINKDELPDNTPLSEFGFDSILLKEFAAKLNEYFNINIMPSLFYSYSTLKALTEYFCEIERVRVPQKSVGKEIQSSLTNTLDTDDDIAIIGISAKLPQAETAEEFWDNLISQKNVITEIPKERWNWEDNYGDLNTSNQSTNSKWGAFIKGIDLFDPEFFRMTPKESELTDPQQRLLLETVWKLFEDAGYKGSELKGRDIGVYIGAQTNEYRDLVREAGYTNGQATVGNALAMLANRISYFFDFHGNSQTVETACSGSLVAIHNAVNAIRNKEISMAVVGGVNLSVTDESYITAARLGILSSEGKCKTFDKTADGYVKGEGVITILLKSFKEAVKDGDHIYALIKGVGVNHGGTASSLTAPNSKAQAQLLKNTYRKAKINPNTITYIETHGTGTELGDPVEIEGLVQAFTELSLEDEKESISAYCGLGSVKTNIGHLEPAAGLAGLVKVILSMKYKTLPGIMNFRELNPYIRLWNTPFHIIDKNKEWIRLKDKNGHEIPRRAGISSFGFGGTNGHLIVEEYEDNNKKRTSQTEELIIFSARSQKVLFTYLESFLKTLEARKGDYNLSEIAYTLQTGREEMKYRAAVIAASIEELAQGITKILNKQTGDTIFTGEAREENRENDYYPGSLTQMAREWVNGKPINWQEFYMEEKYNKISLPTYPFDHQSYWVKKLSQNSNLSVVEEVLANRIPLEHKTLSASVLVQDWMDTAIDYESKSVHMTIHKKHIVIITMEDRENKNMFSMDMVKGLMSVFHKINTMEEIKAVVVTGYDNIFAMGGTRQTLENIASQEESCADASFVYECILNCKVPVIAAMQGHAFGGGFTFGLFADITIASIEGLYSANFMQYGFTPGVGTTYILKEKLGSGLANEMMYTAKTYTGEELCQRGVSIQIKAQKEVYSSAIEVAENITKKPKESIEVFKANMSGVIKEILPAFIEREAKMQEIAFAKLDAHGLIKHFFDRKDDNTQKPEAPEKKNSLKLIQSPIVRQEVQSKGITLKNKKETEEPVFQSFAEQSIKIRQQKHTFMGDFAGSKENDKKKTDIKNFLYEIIEKLTGLQSSNIGSDTSFREMGIDSISGLELIRDINYKYKTNIETIAIYDYSNIEALAEYISEHLEEESRDYGVETPNEDDELKNMLTKLYNKEADIDEVNQYLRR